MSLAPGTRVGVYEIVGLIGAGGMGEVYRAHDPRLARDVALKILPPAVALDPERRERFEREAKTIAALDHPHIVTIYSLEEADGVSFITMQLVRGRTLSELIPRGGMAVRQLLDVAVPLTDALAAAHERGVVHRDVKPGNVMVGDDGQIKVLDFGLAKLREAPGATVLSQLATEHVTREGQIVGTVAYMSPEQAEGRTVDHRSDIFSLGTVLYELATGDRPFKGETALSVMTAILRDSPPSLAAIKADLPRHFGRLVRRCLEKDPQRRYQSAIDLRSDLEDLKNELESGDAAAPPARTPALRSRSGTLIFAASVAFVAALAFVGGWLSRDRMAGPLARSAELRQIQLTANPSNLPVTGAAVSPDGRYLAYTDPDGLYLRFVDSGETHAVPLPAGFRFWDLSWFPDGTRLLAAGHSPTDEVMSLYSVSILGGTPRKLREDGWRAAVSPDGKQIAFLPATYPVSDVWVMGTGGEQPRRIVSATGRELFWQVGWSPDGQRVLWGSYAAARGNSIRTIVLATGQESVVLDDSARLFQWWRGVLPFAWLPDGRFVFARRELPPNEFSSNLWEVDIDVETATTTGEPRRLTEITGFNIRDVRVTSDAGRLSFLRERGQPDVYVAPLERNGTSLGALRRLTLDERHDYAAGWTHDGAAVLFHSNRGGTWDLFRQRIDAGAAEPLVVTSDQEEFPRLSADAAWLLFWRGGNLTRAPAGGGPSELVMPGPRRVSPDSASSRDVVEVADFRCSVPPARRCVVGELSETHLALTEFDPIQGRGRELARFPLDSPGFVNWDLAPDGSRAAVVDFGSHVHIVDPTAGAARDLSVSGWTAFEFVAWAATGDWLWLQGFPAKGPRLVSDAILRLDLNGRVIVLRDEPNEWHVRQVPSPDGRYVATAGMLFESNAWILDDF